MAFFADPEVLPDELIPFSGRLSPRFYEIRKKVAAFCLDVRAVSSRADYDNLKSKAREQGLWNFFLPEVSGLTVLEYSPMAEMLGAVPLANGAMNCSAPDTGNMEVLAKFGNEEQKAQWLEPLLNQEIRSCFAMTEPGVASSDATNISSTIERDGDEYVVNGHKWYISGAVRNSCKIAIFLGKTPNEAFKRHQQQSMILVPVHLEGEAMYPGVEILRSMAVFGHEGDHAEMIFDNVRVPAGNMILGEGRGFEIAQGRLGPGRIHHCMRSIGQAEMALSAMIYRIQNRTAFGTKLDSKDSIRQIIAESRLEVTKCRQLCYLAAVIADERGFKAARKYIAMIKVAAPRMALQVVDEAIQVHGAHGVSQDSKLPGMYTGLRTLRVADGPDIVHMNTIVKEEMKQEINPLAKELSGHNPYIKKYNKAVLPHGYYDDWAPEEKTSKL